MRIEADWLGDSRTQDVLAALTGSDEEALAVGGCVRNTLLDVPVTDIDIATSATPEKTTKIAEKAGFKAVPTGAPHGTITVICRDMPFEVTTFRRDVETDGRRAVVAFTDRIEDDARRRDFTMNALYARADGMVVDPLGGLPDVTARRLRFIENADDRIREDYLRSLRFFRFHAQYGDPDQGLDTQALDAVARNVDGLSTLPAERIGAEVRKLLAARDPAPALAAMAQTGVLNAVLPGADLIAIAPLIHLEGKTAQPPAFIRRLVALGGDDPNARLRLSRAEATERRTILAALGNGTPLSEIAYRHGAAIAWSVALVSAAMASAPVAAEVGADITAGSDATFPLSADHLMPRYEGKALGDMLDKLERAWIDSGFQLSENELLAMADVRG
ncbi:MAG: CCA tRNA nucleotidyltransferase [Pseudomonadota bacterium]